MKYTGGCLCGRVRYEGSEELGGGHCHCNDCRRSSGTGHGSHMLVPAQALAVSGDLKFYVSQADSGNTVRRGFCPDCGSAIYSTNDAMPGMFFVRASSLDDPEVFRPQMVVYTDRAASWDHVDPSLPSFGVMPPPQDMPEAVA